MRPLLAPLLAIASLVAGFASFPAAAIPINLIVNGDFEAGNVGFTSDLTYNPTTITPAAVYAIVDDPSSLHPLAASYGDNTPGSGNVLMMAINGSTNSNDIVWAQDVAVTPMTSPPPSLAGSKPHRPT